MIRLADRKDCCGCGACAAACPHEAITMVPDGMGFRYPRVDPDRCVDCHLCEDVCSFTSNLRSKDVEGQYLQQEQAPASRSLQTAFPSTSSDTPVSGEAIRFPELMDRSQSGGLAFALMRKAIRSGMVVYGAAMDDDFVVRHRRVETMEGLEPLRLSKYVQSDMEGDSTDKPWNDGRRFLDFARKDNSVIAGEGSPVIASEGSPVIASECGQSVPRQVLEDLKAGRRVLFTGTPCQCAGVGSLCRKYRDQLLLADILCHGVPAPFVWRDYLREQEQRHGKKLTRALFRDPSLGWHEHKEVLFFGEERVVSGEYTDLFYRHLMLRPSCTVCPYASVTRVSDLTMADCWGVEKALPGFADDNRGCSLLLRNTSAGVDFSADFPDEAVERRAVALENVMQPNFLAPSQPKDGAQLFENTYIRRGYPVAERRCRPGAIRIRLLRWARKAGIKL